MGASEVLVGVSGFLAFIPIIYHTISILHTLHDRPHQFERFFNDWEGELSLELFIFTLLLFSGSLIIGGIVEEYPHPVLQELPRIGTIIAVLGLAYYIRTMDVLTH